MCFFRLYEKLLLPGPMQIRSPFLRIILAFLALAAQTAWAQDGLRGAESKAANASWLLSPLTSRIVAADFDNDQKLDGALLIDAGVIDGQRMFRIELHVSASENRNLLFASNDPSLAISALDVNSDGMPDLVVEQAFTHKRLQVWLNDGHGGFRRARAEDFPSLTETPCKWRAPFLIQASLVAGLPSRHEILIPLLQIHCFDSSSSRWKIRREVLPDDALVSPSCSPRAPPSSLSL